jgi:isoquinoline 1-oxidoreductase subunit alpha
LLVINEAGMRSKMLYELTINGSLHTVDVEGETPLLWVLRDTLDLKGTKFGCGSGLCGSCTVHLNGVAIRSCVKPISSVNGGAITTIEGVSGLPVGRKVQDAWLELDVAQCGYCQAGQIMSAAALLTRTPKPDDSEINAGMSGNICRCATYTRIRAAIKLAAANLTKEG